MARCYTVRRHGFDAAPSLIDKLARELDQDDSAVSLKLVACGGEVFAPAVMLRLRARLGPNVHNVYGLTEATIYATAWQSGSETHP